MASRGTVAIKFVGDISSLNKSIDDVNGKLGGFKNTAGKIAAVAGGAFASAKAVDFLAGSISDAADEKQGIEVLANTLKNAGVPKDVIDSTETWITKFQNATGIMDSDLRPALGKLVIAGQSVAQAQDDMAVAADIAAARHKPLATVVDAMAKAAQGNTTALGRMGVQTKDASGKALTFHQILQNASKTMGGSAAAAAKTAAGKAAILRAKFADLKENIGNALMPILETLTNALMKVTGWFNNLSPGMQKVVLIVGGLLVALGPVVALVGTITTAIGGLSAAFAFLAANPIVLVIAAIVGLVAGLVIAYQKVGWFHDFVNASFNAVKDIAETVFNAIKTAVLVPFNFIKDHWPLLLAILTGPIGAAVVLIVSHWDTVKDLFSKITGFVTSVLGGLKDAIVGPFKAAFNAIARLWNSTIGKLHFKIPGWVPGIGGKGFDVPDIPTFKAMGGPVSAFKPYIVGERGPELFVPNASGNIVPNNRIGGKQVVQHFDLRGIRDPNAVAEIVNRLAGGNLGLQGGY